MKIAILTLPLHTNYGGILQAYALQTVLERMGHTVEVLQKKPGYAHPWYIMPIVYAKRIAKKILKDWRTPIFEEQQIARDNKIIRQNTDRFIRSHIHLREIKSLKEIAPDDYEAIVVGSDQIWRKPYFKGMWNASIENAFLSFTKGWNIRRIAYAASFGKDNIDEYTKEEIIACCNPMRLFNAISVREENGVAICSYYLNKEAIQLPDPTFLLSAKDYVNLLSDVKLAKPKPSILSYILDEDEDKKNFIENISKERGLKTISIYADVDNKKLHATQRIQPPLEYWLKGFNDAEFVVTDSFHACVFSIIFNKPFLVFSNENRGISRLNSLLEKFCLNDRIIRNFNHIQEAAFKKINWKTINEIIMREQERSLSFFASNLS